MGNEDLPPWLAKEMEDADFIPMPDDVDESSMKTAWIKGNSKTKPLSNTTSSIYGVHSTTKMSSLDANLILRIKELEEMNDVLLKKVREQEETIKSLRKQNEVYVESNKKLLELSIKTGNK